MLVADLDLFSRAGFGSHMVPLSTQCGVVFEQWRAR